MCKSFLFNTKAHFVCALVLFFSFQTSAQYNLVPNPSFETLSIDCDSIRGNNGGALYWNSQIVNAVQRWISIYAVFNTCASNNCCKAPFINNKFSYQNAHTGNGYIGMLLYSNRRLNTTRDYVQTKLIENLKKDKSYYIEMWTNVIDIWKYAINNIGLLVTDTAIWSSSRGIMLASPQILQFGNPVIKDTQNWVKVAGIYKAHGGEQYISIGNFADYAHTDTLIANSNGASGNGYLFDDISVIPLDSMQLNADAGRDTIVNKGDSVWIGSRLCGLIMCSGMIVWVNPLLPMCLGFG